MRDNLYSKKNNLYRKKTAALPAAALPFTAADRNLSRTAKNFFEILLAIGQSGSAALPLPRVLPFLFYTTSLFCVYIFHAQALRNSFFLKNYHGQGKIKIKRKAERRGKIIFEGHLRHGWTHPRVRAFRTWKDDI